MQGKMPTEIDKRHISPLAQEIIELVQQYAVRESMSLPGVMSAVGTAAGALLARAYSDPETAKMVAGQLSIAANEMAAFMYKNDPIIKARQN